MKYSVHNSDLKSTTPRGTNRREEKIYKNNTEWMTKTEKKFENTVKRNQESGMIKKQIKSTNLDVRKSDSKEKTGHRVKLQTMLVMYLSGGKVRL